MSLELHYGSGAIALPAAALDCNAGLIEWRVLAVLCAERGLLDRYPEGIEELARAAGCEVGAVREAVAFWSGTGILTSADRQDASRTVKVDRGLIRDTLPDYSAKELAELVEAEQGELKLLIDECQRMLGKMLSRTEIEKLAALSDYLRLEKEYILLLVSYCVRENKRSMAYIVRTAYGLFNDGIDDYPKLDAHISRRERYRSVIHRIRRMMGLGERELTKKENGFISQWIEEYALPIEVIELAYQVTVDSIKEVSFDYMGKILTAWHEAGAVTVEAAQALIDERREKNRGGGEDDYRSFRTDEFFEAALKRSRQAMSEAGKE